MRLNAHILLAPLAFWLAGLCVPAFALDAGVSWDWQLQAPLDLSVEVDVLALDPDEVDRADISRLKARGVFTICYVSVGTWEDWRDDADLFSPALLGKPYDGWPGERFLDIRAPEALARMEARFRRCARMGFDAVEPDNIDLHINDTGLPIGKAEVIAYVRQLSRAAHRLGLQIAQKNAGDLTRALVPLTDFAMAENCLSDGWCARLAPHARAGQAILAAEYTRPSRRICARAGQQGLSLIFKRRSLTRWRALCP